MRCALVIYVVATIFVVVYGSVPELCEFKDEVNWGKQALCGRDDVQYTFDFIPPISQNISYINLNRQPLRQLPDNAFRNLTSQSSITRIAIQYCQISHVDAGALLNLHTLTAIYLSFNDINQIDSKLFSSNKQIKNIYMGHNKIEVLPSGLFQNLLLLEQVHLNDNRIHHVEKWSFQNTPSLWMIDLSFNQIEFMNVSFKDKFDNLIYLYLYFNPWKCDCELGPFYELLLKYDPFNQDLLVCKTPPTLQGSKWEDLSRDVFVCPSEKATSTQDSVMTSTEPMATTEQGDNKLVADYDGTRNRQVGIGTPQPPLNQNWILYTILVLVLVCVAAVIVGVVLLKRRSLAASKCLQYGQ